MPVIFEDGSTDQSQNSETEGLHWSMGGITEDIKQVSILFSKCKWFVKSILSLASGGHCGPSLNFPPNGGFTGF